MQWSFPHAPPRRYLLMASATPLVVVVYFLAVVILGGFFAVNLFLAGAHPALISSRGSNAMFPTHLRARQRQH